MTGPLCPDVLALLSDERLTVEDVLQCALGVFPPGAALDQPLEVLLLLQNLTDQPLDVQLSLRVPTRDGQGNLLNFFTPRPRMSLTLPGCESGLLHLPVTPQLPTPPGAGYPLRVQIALRKPEHFRTVRALAAEGGSRLLPVSPVRIAVLRDVDFSAHAADPQQLEIAIDVLPGRLPPRAEQPAARYESLWTAQDVAQEQARLKAAAPEALRFARTLVHRMVFEPLLAQTHEVFGGAGIPLHPGEAVFITKTLAYVIDNGLELEPGFSLAEGEWFQRLCWVLAYQPETLSDLPALLRLLYTAVVQDGVQLGFSLVTFSTRAHFGDANERAAYAARLVASLERRAPLGPEQVYVPLIMAGLLLCARITGPDEKPWHSLEQLDEARDLRARQAGPAFREIKDLLDRVTSTAIRSLVELRVPRE